MVAVAGLGSPCRYLCSKVPSSAGHGTSPDFLRRRVLGVPGFLGRGPGTCRGNKAPTQGETQAPLQSSMLPASLSRQHPPLPPKPPADDPPLETAASPQHLAPDAPHL
ncbi:hypothetical protein PG985_007885 [Apiospora marii]|uniref:Uncharacterized protein n=1 Tax=Apiospora marii TaxID=335849 RepID=A0ABR1R8U5_9PEZI